MVAQRLSNLSAVRKQNLLVEFSSLKYACPHGVFMCLTPGDPTLWSGVMFVRKGAISPILQISTLHSAELILRASSRTLHALHPPIQISFPPTYPSLPPLVTFSTDMFHPLITPLTTYMYTTDTNDSGTVSATDEERLPPGGFSLRHGFPGWFGRSSRKSAERDRNHPGDLQTPPRGSGVSSPGSGSLSPTPVKGTSESVRSTTTTRSGVTGKREEVSTYEVLRYIRSTFDDEEVLDSVPLEAAGNPGAWHAWRTHRAKVGKINSPTHPIPGTGPSPDDALIREVKQRVASGGSSAPMTARRPGEWNWEGVWAVRVKKGVEASLAEAVLYGRDAGDDLIRFLNMEEGDVQGIKENIVRSLEGYEETRRGIV